MDKEPPPLSDTEVGKRLNKRVVEKTGFEPADIAEAPFKTPKLKPARRKISGLQLLLVIVGSVIAMLGLVIMLADNAVIVGLLMTAIGAVAVVVGALVRL